MENSQNNEHNNDQLYAVINKLIMIIVVLIIGVISIPIFIYYSNQPEKVNDNVSSTSVSTPSKEIAYWTAPDINNITDPKLKASVSYGKEFICSYIKIFRP